MMSQGNSFGNGESAMAGYLGGKTTERECPFIARVLRPVEVRV